MARKTLGGHGGIGWKMIKGIGIHSSLADDMQVCPTYVGRWSSISLYRDCWAQHEVKRSDSNRRTSIKLQADKDGTNGCYIGVWSPMAVDEMAHGDKERRQRLDQVPSLECSIPTGECCWGGYIAEETVPGISLRAKPGSPGSDSSGHRRMACSQWPDSSAVHRRRSQRRCRDAGRTGSPARARRHEPGACRCPANFERVHSLQAQQRLEE